MESNIQELALAFAKYIPILAGTAGMKSARFIIATVKRVDEDTRSCSLESVLDNDTTLYEDVNLSAERNDGFILIPAIDSTVIAAIMPTGEVYVTNCSDISKVICFIDSSNKFEFSSSGFIFNGGTFDGLVKVNQLVTKLNNLENLLNDLVGKFNAHTHPVPGVTTGAGATTSSVTTMIELSPFLTPTVKNDIENPNIKQ